MLLQGLAPVGAALFGQVPEEIADLKEGLVVIRYLQNFDDGVMQKGVLLHADGMHTPLAVRAQDKAKCQSLLRAMMQFCQGESKIYWVHNQ